MRYWVHLEGRVQGPFEPAALARLPGMHGGVLACPEGSSRERADWKPVSSFPELSVPARGRSRRMAFLSLLATALLGVGGFFHLRPAEKTPQLPGLSDAQLENERAQALHLAVNYPIPGLNKPLQAAVGAGKRWSTERVGPRRYRVSAEPAGEDGGASFLFEVDLDAHTLSGANEAARRMLEITGAAAQP